MAGKHYPPVVSPEDNPLYHDTYKLLRCYRDSTYSLKVAVRQVERTAYRGTEDAAQRISDLEREIKQREQSREYSSIKERLEAGRQSIADREREVAKRKRHDRGMSR